MPVASMTGVSSVTVLLPPFDGYEGLGLFIDAQDDMEVVAQAYTADDAVRQLEELPRKSGLMVLVALETGGEHDAFWLIRHLREAHPTSIVVACSASSVKASVSRA